jgi:uncharacterized RDD family membrane protein YckC
MHGDPAGFWIRFIAFVFDAIILVVILYGISLALGESYIQVSRNGEPAPEQSLTFQILQFLVPLLYGAGFLAAFGTTPGKKVLNVHVFDETGKRKLSFFRALGRELSKYLSAIILLIGYIMAAFRSDKRALHDLMAGTYPTIRSRYR